jgi:hypothetical protein
MAEEEEIQSRKKDGEEDGGQLHAESEGPADVEKVPPASSHDNDSAVILTMSMRPPLGRLAPSSPCVAIASPHRILVGSPSVRIARTVRDFSLSLSVSFSLFRAEWRVCVFSWSNMRKG